MTWSALPSPHAISQFEKLYHVQTVRTLCDRNFVRVFPIRCFLSAFEIVREINRLTFLSSAIGTGGCWNTHAQRYICWGDTRYRQRSTWRRWEPSARCSMGWSVCRSRSCTSDSTLLNGTCTFPDLSSSPQPSMCLHEIISGHQPIDGSIGNHKSARRSAIRPVGQSIGPSVSQAVGRTIGQSTVDLRIGWPVSRSGGLSGDQSVS